MINNILNYMNFNSLKTRIADFLRENKIFKLYYIILKFFYRNFIFFIAFLFDIKYFLLNKFNKSYGVKEKKRKEKIIISLTTIPNRLHKLYLIIEPLLRQTVKPDKIIIWIPEKYINPIFKDFEFKLPKKLIEQKSRGLEIKKIKDIGSHNKIYYSLKNYPNDCVISVDDDVFYPKKFIENIYNAYKKNGEKFIYTYRSFFLKKLNKKNLEMFIKWKRVPENFIGYHKNLFSEAGAGVLYPPNIFKKEAFNIKSIQKLTPYSDDVWYNSMARLSGMKYFKVKQPSYDPIELNGVHNITLVKKNNKGRKDVFLKNVFNHYNLYKFFD